MTKSEGRNAQDNLGFRGSRLAWGPFVWVTHVFVRADDNFHEI